MVEVRVVRLITVKLLATKSDIDFFVVYNMRVCCNNVQRSLSSFVMNSPIPKCLYRLEFFYFYPQYIFNAVKNVLCNFRTSYRSTILR